LGEPRFFSAELSRLLFNARGTLEYAGLIERRRPDGGRLGEFRPERVMSTIEERDPTQSRSARFRQEPRL
jgi:hypothetical protein